MPIPRDLALQAIDLVYGDRPYQHGPAIEVYGKVSALWSGFLGIEITPEQAALMMVLLKIAREDTSPKDDNVVDAHGYLLVYGRIRGGE